jgi:hypothetical protein
MNDMSRMSLNELIQKNAGLEAWMIMLAGELGDVDAELAKRYESFKALCFASGVPSKTRVIIKPRSPESGLI